MNTPYPTDHEGQIAENEAANAGRFFLAFLLIALFIWLALIGLKSRWRQFVFWLTTDKICSWCQKKTHRALVPIATPSHGICPACRTKYFNF